jgi:hypothetical protein
MSSKMNKNWTVLNETKISSEFMDIRHVDGQTLPINFKLIYMAFLLLTHKEHSKLDKNTTN